MDSSQPTPKHGNSQEQAIRRLKKFRPDLLEKVERGELSYSKAMINAGLKSRAAQFNPDRSNSVIDAILRHYDKQQIKYIIRQLQEKVK